MKYLLQIEEGVYKTFKRLEKKNKKQLHIINKKIKQICENPYHFKPLKGDMKGSRRVHIDKSFVLIYDVDESNKIIKIIDYNHHDKIY